MNSPSTDSLSAAYAALADPTRRAILLRLAEGEASVGDLTKPFAISGPAISRHLRVLENARLIEREVNAQWRICRLHPPGLRVAMDWLSQYRSFWDQSLDRLVRALEQDQRPATSKAATSRTTRTRPSGARPRNNATRAPSARKRKPS